MQDAVAPTEGGTLLRVDLTPGADEDVFPSGFNEWRDCVEARVRAPPQDGEANRALVGLVAEHFDLPSAAVRIKSGRTARRKTLFLSGVDVAEVAATVEGVQPP